jgi:hypothetical protein
VQCGAVKSGEGGGPEEKSSLRGAGRTGLIARYRVQEKAPRRGGWWRRGGAVHGMLGEECACACLCVLVLVLVLVLGGLGFGVSMAGHGR